MTESSDELPRMLSGRYRLESPLGHGGMGVVYRGTDFTMKRPVAVKLVRTQDGHELDEEIAGRFLREAKNTARLHHENIVEVFDLGRTDDGLYLVMELLAGESLSVRLKRDGKLAPGKTVQIARQICEALEVAHAAGVVHRDLKPANVMLITRAGNKDFVKVLDFGVSKSFMGEGDATQLTHTGMLVGTVDYMSPEQITGKAIDGRTDVYALGIVLYKMLSGKAPFRDTSVPALIHAHLNRMPKPLIELVPGLPNALDHVVLRCLAKNPERRFDSMAELARALTAALPSEGVADLSFGAGADSDARTRVVPKSAPPPQELDSEDETLHFDRTPADLERIRSAGPRGRDPEKADARRPSASPPAGSPRGPASAGDEGVSGVSGDETRQDRAFRPSKPAPPHFGDVTVAVPGAPPRVPVTPPPPRMPSHAPYAAPAPPPPRWAPPTTPPYPMAPPPPPPEPPSMWRRFLTWTGLRSR